MCFGHVSPLTTQLQPKFSFYGVTRTKLPPLPACSVHEALTVTAFLLLSRELNAQNKILKIALSEM
jgi:hypothetical protein